MTMDVYAERHCSVLILYISYDNILDGYQLLEYSWKYLEEYV